MEKKIIKVVLVGFPNVGKTALLNSLAGSNLKIGNWPGVTVERKEAQVEFKNHIIEFVDLPGIYDLKPLNAEETVTRNTLLTGNFDLVINVIDATNVNRNIALTEKLISKVDKKFIFIFNMWDELKRNQLDIHIDDWAKDCGFCVFKTTALKLNHKKQILNAIVDSYESDKFKNGKFLNIDKYVLKGDINRKLSIVDRIILNKWFGIPIFVVLMYLVFKITFDASGPMIDFVDGFFNGFIYKYLAYFLSLIHAPAIVSSLVLDGIFAGIALLMTFIPLLVFLFLFIAILEESGYMARAAFIMDRIMRPFGLRGKSVLPLLIGFGCNVPAIYATRTLETEKNKKITSAVMSFMSCGAKLPIYLLFTTVFFVDNRALVILSIYLIGMIVALIWSSILGRFYLKKDVSFFFLEIPPYRWPQPKIIFLSVWSRVRSFIKNAGTLIAATMIVIWALLNLPYGAAPENTILGWSAKIATPIFEPLGFGDRWENVAAILPGLIAKEVVVGSVAQLYTDEEDSATGESNYNFFTDLSEQMVLGIRAIYNSIGGVFEGFIPGVFIADANFDSGLIYKLKQAFTPLKAYSFMIFNLLLVSCCASMGAIADEFGKKFLLKVIVFTTITSYIVSMLIYQIGSLIT